jgi:hypothetical protein
MMRGSRTIRTTKNRAAVLRELAAGWSVHSATQRAGIGYVSYYDWRSDDPTFRAEADAAIEAATDLLEDEARRRAMDTSDLLLIFLLRSRRPRIYNRRTIETGSSIAAPPPVAVSHSDNKPRIYIPDNRRQLPEVFDEPHTIEGAADDDAA